MSSSSSSTLHEHDECVGTNPQYEDEGRTPFVFEFDLVTVPRLALYVNSQVQIIDKCTYRDLNLGPFAHNFAGPAKTSRQRLQAGRRGYH